MTEIEEDSLVGLQKDTWQQFCSWILNSSASVSCQIMETQKNHNHKIPSFRLDQTKSDFED